jgi:hypothetical protein
LIVINNLVFSVLDFMLVDFFCLVENRDIFTDVFVVSVVLDDVVVVWHFHDFVNELDYLVLNNLFFYIMFLNKFPVTDDAFLIFCWKGLSENLNILRLIITQCGKVVIMFVVVVIIVRVMIMMIMMVMNLVMMDCLYRVAMSSAII